MPSVQRPDSPAGSGSTEFRDEAATFTAGSELLKEFASEAVPQPSALRGAQAAPRLIRNEFTINARLLPNTPVWLETARRLPPRPPASRRRSKKFWKSLRARVHALCLPGIAAIRVPARMKRLPNLRRVAATATLWSFAGGSAAGALIVWFAAAQPASSAAPSPQVVPTQTTLPLPDAPAPPAEPPLQADTVRALAAPEPEPIVAVAARERTRERSNPGVNPAVIRTRPTQAAGGSSRTAAARPASYRGSLAFRSAPQGARVFLNGQFVGSTPLVLQDLPVGSRAVRIEADGYQRWSASTRVVANQQTRVSATLGPAAP